MSVRVGDVFVCGEARLLVGDVNPLGGVCDDCPHDTLLRNRYDDTVSPSWRYAGNVFDGTYPT